MLAEYYLPSSKMLPADTLVPQLLEVVHDSDLPVEKLLRGTGIFAQDIATGTDLSPEQVLALIANITKYNRDKATPFQMGKSLAANQSSAVFRALSYADNFDDALSLMRRYQGLWSPFLSWQVVSNGHWDYWLLQDAIGLHSHQQTIIEMYASVVAALAKHWLGRRGVVQFTFPWKQPSYIQEYEVNLGAQLTFGSPVAWFRFDRELFHQKFIHANDCQRHYATQQCDQLPSHLSLLDTIRNYLRENSSLSLVAMSQRLAMSPASLKRKLKEQHYSFRRLCDEVDKQNALDCLCIQKLNNEQSARQMAFSDTTNFRRTVKRLTGLTPNELRAAVS